jgi:hypothetical protein
VQCEAEFTLRTEIEGQAYSPDYEWPLKAKQAVVRRIDADVFVVEFLELLPAQRERLRMLLAE